MNKQSKRFYEIIDVIKELHDKKQHDYADTDDIFANFRLSELAGTPAWQGSVIRMGDKYARICNFIKKGEFKFKEENIKGGADVRSLESVLKNDNAKGKFLNLVDKGGDASINALKTVAMEMVVDSPDVPLKEADLSALSLELNKKLGSLKYEQVQRWKDGIDLDSYHELLSIRDFMSSYEEEVDSNK